MTRSAKTNSAIAGGSSRPVVPSMSVSWAEKLHRMMGAWSAAVEIRSFLEAIEREVAPEIRARPELAAFVTWAASRADALDPLRRPEELAKDVDVELLGAQWQG